MSFRLLLVLCMLSCASFAQAEILSGNVNFLLGTRTMMDDDWDDFEVQDQGMFGLNVDLKLPAMPGIEFGFLGSRADGDTQFTEADVSLSELFAGVNKTWEVGAARPFIGGGLTIRTITTEIEVLTIEFDDDDTDLALYFHGGVFWRLGDHFNLGFDFRTVVGGEMELFNNDVNANSWAGSLILGYGW